MHGELRMIGERDEEDEAHLTRSLELRCELRAPSCSGPMTCVSARAQVDMCHDSTEDLEVNTSRVTECEESEQFPPCLNGEARNPENVTDKSKRGSLDFVCSGERGVVSVSNPCSGQTERDMNVSRGSETLVMKSGSIVGTKTIPDGKEALEACRWADLSEAIGAQAPPA